MSTVAVAILECKGFDKLPTFSNFFVRAKNTKNNTIFMNYTLKYLFDGRSGRVKIFKCSSGSHNLSMNIE